MENGLKVVWGGRRTWRGTKWASGTPQGKREMLSHCLGGKNLRLGKGGGDAPCPRIRIGAEHDMSATVSCMNASERMGVKNYKGKLQLGPKQGREVSARRRKRIH